MERRGEGQRPSLRSVLGALGRVALFAVVLLLVWWAVGAFVWRIVPGHIAAAGVEPELASLVGGGVAMLIAALLAAWIVMALVDHRRPGSLGFAWRRRTPWQIGLGLLIGGGALAVVVLALAAAGRVAWRPDAGTGAGYAVELGRDLLFFGVAAAAEEALFRGYPFQALVEGMGPVAATLLASAGFALAHEDNPGVDWIAFANIFLAGVVLSVAYLRTRSLWFATAVHLGWNWTMATLLALPVSGLVVVDTPLYDARVGGPAWLTGGRFGPEGGLVATVALAIAFVAVLRWARPAAARAPREL